MPKAVNGCSLHANLTSQNILLSIDAMLLRELNGPPSKENQL